MEYEDDELLHMEALYLISQASDDMLVLATIEEIDLTAIARQEYRARRRVTGHEAVAALARNMEPG